MTSYEKIATTYLVATATTVFLVRTIKSAYESGLAIAKYESEITELKRKITSLESTIERGNTKLSELASTVQTLILQFEIYKAKDS